LIFEEKSEENENSFTSSSYYSLSWLALSYNCDIQLGAENVLVDLTLKEKNMNNLSKNTILAGFQVPTS